MAPLFLVEAGRGPRGLVAASLLRLAGTAASPWRRVCITRFLPVWTTTASLTRVL